MTYESQSSKSQYAGNGVATSFPTGFKFLKNSHVHAVLTVNGVDEALVEGTDYSLTGAGVESGGSVVYPATGSARHVLAVGERLSIYLAPPIAQDKALSQATVVDLREIEQGLDMLTMTCQALDEKIARSLKYPMGTPAEEVGKPDEYLNSLQTARSAAETAATASASARTGAETARAGAEAARDAAASSAASLELQTIMGSIAAVENGLMSLAMKQAVQAGDTDRSILMNGWLDPLTDAGQVALTGMEFQSGDTGYIQPTPAGSGVAVQNIVYAAQRGTNLKGSITTFTVDTANTSGHFDSPAHTGIRAGTYGFVQKDGVYSYPAISNVTGDGTTANSVTFTGTLPVGVYSVTGVYALATTEPVGTYMWQLNATIGHAVGYAYAFDLPPFDATHWTAITGAAADAWTSRNPGGQVFWCVSFNGGGTYVVWTGAAWRGIVQNNAGTWRYYNPGTAQWVNATINDRLMAFSEALTLTANWWSLTPFYGLYTTDILTGGVVTASCANPAGSQANLVDNNTSTAWGSTAISTALPAWVKYQLPSAKRAWKYRLNVTTNPAYSPHDWQFQGSNDGVAWTTLDTQSGQTWAAAGWKEYSIPEANRGSYLYYRLYITAGGQAADNYMWIDEWEVYEEVAVINSMPDITQAQWAQTYGFQAGTTTDVRFLAALRTTDKALGPYIKSLTMTVNRTTANGSAEFNAFAAVDPDIGRAVFVMQAVDDITLDTDLKAWMKRGAGAYTQVPLVQDSAYDATRVLVRGELDMSATPGTTAQLKLTTHNNKAVKVFQASNYFKSKA